MWYNEIMKRLRIAVATDDCQQVAESFGKARGFMIYDCQGKAIQPVGFRQNDFTCHAKDMHHEHYTDYHHDVILSALGDCQVLIAGHIGSRLVEDAESLGKTCYLIEDVSILEAVKYYLKGKTGTHADMPHCP